MPKTTKKPESKVLCDKCKRLVICTCQENYKIPKHIQESFERAYLWSSVRVKCQDIVKTGVGVDTSDINHYDELMELLDISVDVTEDREFRKVVTRGFLHLFNLHDARDVAII